MSFKRLTFFLLTGGWTLFRPATSCHSYNQL